LSRLDAVIGKNFAFMIKCKKFLADVNNMSEERYISVEQSIIEAFKEVREINRQRKIQRLPFDLLRCD